MRSIALPFACCLAAITAFAQPKVSNRDPKPNEIGYRPAEGSNVRLNPPSFIWLHEPAAHRYSIQWSRAADFRDAALATNLWFNTYTHGAPLAPGTYYWRYRFITTNGAESTWSQTRSVIVPDGATEFPMPNRVEQRARVPQQHPRLFMRPEDLPRLRAWAAGKGSEEFAKLRAEADRIIKAGPTPEPEHMGSARDKEDKELIKYWWPNREQTMKACQEAETIAFVYLLSHEAKYGEAARQWILHLAAWNPDGPTNFRMNCEAGKPMLYRPARAYDWAYDALTSEDRQVVQRVMARRVKDAWESGEIQRGVGHLNSPYNSHGNRIWHKVGEAGVVFLGEIPDAETWLDYAVNKFHACYPVWADDDGGWHEGASYWAGYLNKAVWWLQVAQSALQVDGLKKPFFAQVGDFPMYVAPPGSPNQGFGDLSFNRPSAGTGGFMEYFIRAKGNQADGAQAAHWRWWTEQWKMRGEGGVLGFLYEANLPAMPAAKPPTDLPQSKIFHGIGVASLHSTLLDSADDVHLLFKSSPFGTQSHGHNPHNGFQLNAYGEALLTTCTYRDLHGSKFHYNWAHSTVAHNAVLVNGEGQIKHTPASHGRIVAERLTKEWDYVAGDATEAYGGKLTRYVRHIAFAKPDIIVIYDELVAKEPATFQFMLHGLSEFTVSESEGSVVLNRPKAGVTAQYLSSVPLKFRQWDGYDPKPTKEFPNQWHVEASTQQKATEAGMLTVLVPHRAGKAPKWSSDRIESATAIGARVRFGDVATVIAFAKGGMKSGEVAGVQISDRAVVTQKAEAR
jgi:hypothetical protein